MIRLQMVEAYTLYALQQQRAHGTNNDVPLLVEVSFSFPSIFQQVIDCFPKLE
jgi:hypothetical protein